MLNKRKIIFEDTNGYQPTWLPQIKSDYKRVLKELDDQGIKYSFVAVKPTSLIPMQDTVKTETVDHFANKIANNEEIPPIFVSNSNEILDGVHRQQAFKNNPKVKEIYCIKLAVPTLDGARILNKIQDRHDWEDQIDQETGLTPVDNSKIKDYQVMDEAKPVSNKKTMELYRMKPMNEKSATGNFFLYEKKDRYNHKYTIDFDNIYEIPDEKIKGDDPINSLAEEWFDMNNIREEAAKKVVHYDDYIVKKIAEEAKKRGYDGIKYGSKYFQSI
jgi:hypothetical protein